MNGDLIPRHLIFNHDYFLVQPILLLHYNVGKCSVSCYLLLGLGEHRCMLGLFSLQARILDPRHGVKVLPACDLTRLRVSLHRNLLERVLGGR